ncbi:electron transport protein HydN [Shewanella sp. A3A]|uniref:Electron transport protein HydN n=1 Tax=Shewanella electrica TaxID=515560 RepID=A0ABT2FFH1_9GAMM|nr:electron transport protein HydN [Shewanella electrica]MCH1917931.1 electron transport protein HydN [Shewanella ferrihydritica]MCH1925127.1 electron transport protein HydN [Shewanella electrica]MCS4554951.1 electron transport protein HydN [Shewanella electrica]
MNRFILADANKCIGCRTCEVACAVAHRSDGDVSALNEVNFTPRIHVIKGAYISTAATCRQCEDAPCANVCPNHAIRLENGFVHVLQENCIGCKTCVVACPYGAMEVVTYQTVRDTGAAVNVQVTKAQANKCDLCHTRAEGPACVEVCPTEALHCVDRAELERLTAEKRRRTALEASAHNVYA